MGKVGQRERSEVEYLRGIVKRLKSENRQLKKRLSVLTKKSHLYDDILDDAVADEPKSVDIKCTKCNKGNINILDFVHIRLKVCGNPDCGFKERLPREKAQEAKRHKESSDT